MKLTERLTAPGILRLYLASAVVLQHARGGALGTVSVYLFFVLSGYWISVLWRTKYSQCARPYAVFITSRYWRLMPTYLVSLCLTALCLRRYSQWWPSWWAIQFHSPSWLLSTFFILGSATRPLILPPTWSLDVEMQFYLLAPLIIRASAKAFTEPRIKAALLFTGCALLFLVIPVGNNLLPHLGFFLAGCALERTRWNPPPWLPALSTALGAAFYCAVMREAPGILAEAYQGMAKRGVELGCALLAIPFVALALRRKSDRVDRMMGDFAYPVYLFHYICFLLIDHVGVVSHLSPLPRLAIYLASTFAGAAALFFLVDRPVDHTRREFVERKVREARDAPGGGALKFAPEET